MSRERQEESYTAELLRRLTSGTVEVYDTGSRQAVYDLRMVLPGGLVAAVEVTRLTDPAGAELNSRLAADEFKWPPIGLSWTWTVCLSPQTSIREVRRDLAQVLRRCEGLGLTHPSASGPEDPGAFFDRHHLDAWGHPRGPARLNVLPQGDGGGVLEVAAVADWLTRETTQPRTIRKIDKLAAAQDVDRRELVLVVNDDGIPFPEFYALAWSDGLPKRSPVIPHCVDRIWLVPQWSQRTLIWDRQAGWSSHQMPS